MEPTDAVRDEERVETEAATAGEGAVAIETETGVLVYEPGRPDAWIHAEFDAAVEE
ncbi:hypothetical protein SAMN06269185_1244 [Natronoarchaeum philippinense]|uniref:Uncharacterized protein n=1 Tax=Natronoarchaeum philippinense TaxID=558529 RepID=A0A285NBH8_NATPI|nr:hypothetical protein [Natronoarchaeum philippinense]SNZ06658.1 hypothetical protein SAMN06269185_1244 [Natronoarchaeum philippinense]